MLYRHGDVLLADIPDVPAGARVRDGLVLAYGEATGHSHRVEPREAAQLYELENILYLRVAKDATLLHEEHGPIALKPGSYRVWRQREYTPREIRVVVD